MSALPHTPPQLPTGTRGERVTLDDAWSAARDQLLRGLVHALSNRVMALSTLAELSVDGADAEGGRVMAGEARRLEQLLQQFRLITPVQTERPEPLHLAELTHQVAALLERHGETRDVGYDVIVAADAPPGFGIASHVARHLAVLLLAASRIARRVTPHAVELRVGGDDRTAFVIMSVGAVTSTSAGPIDGPPSSDRGMILRIEEPSDDAARYTLVLPSLAEARRRGE